MHQRARKSPVPTFTVASSGANWRSSMSTPPSSARGSVDSADSDVTCSTTKERRDTPWEVVQLPFAGWSISASARVQEIEVHDPVGTPVELSPRSPGVPLPQCPEYRTERERAPVTVVHRSDPVELSPTVQHRVDPPTVEPTSSIKLRFGVAFASDRHTKSSSKKANHCGATSLPDGPALDVAFACRLLDEYGRQTTFGDVIDRKHRTVVLFIRHFWCGFCQTYLEHLASIVRDEDVQRRVAAAKVNVVIIGQGHRSMLSKYRAVLKCPFPIYTDPSSSNDLYTALGMTRRTTDAGPACDKGDYLAGVSMTDAIIKGTVNGLKMPLFVSPGDMKLLGGEFVFEPLRPRSIRRKPPRSIDNASSSARAAPHRSTITSSYPLLVNLALQDTLEEERQARQGPARSTLLPAVPNFPSFGDATTLKGLRHSSIPLRPGAQSRASSSVGREERRLERERMTGSMAGTENSPGEETGKVGRRASVVRFAPPPAQIRRPSSPSTESGTVEIRCRYAHRMSTTRDHASVCEVFAAAGVLLRPEGLTPYAPV